MRQTSQPTRPVLPPAPPSKPGRRARRRALPTAAGVALLAVVSLVGLLRLVHRGEALPGVVVDGVAVGGLGRRDARAALAGLVTARQRDTITFLHGDDEFVYVPGSKTYRANLDRAVQAAFEPGRTGGLVSSSWAHVAALWRRPIAVELPDDLNPEPVATWVRRVAAKVDRRPFPGRVTADPDTLEVHVRPPAPGLRAQQHETVRTVLRAVTIDGSVTVPLPVEVIPQRVPDEDVAKVAAQARRALERPLILDAHEGQLRLSRRQLARLIASKPVPVGDGVHTLVLDVPVKAVAQVFAPHLDRLNVEPRSATFKVVSGFAKLDAKGDVGWTQKPAQVAVVGSADGWRFDPELAAEQLTGLLRVARRGAELQLVRLAPKLTTEEAQALGITQLIGTFTTYHKCCQPRVRNIHRLADLVRGTVIEPGEVVSVNRIAGRRTRAKGFVADGTIVRGEYVDEVGGGVSQFATTMFNAAFFAGLEFVEYKSHSYYISRYPMGREATLYYPSVDLKIRNTTGSGVYVHTAYTETSVTVSLFGNNGGLTVAAEHGRPFNFRRTKTIYRENNELPRGSSRVVQGGGSRGFDVVVHRVVGDRRERFFTRYQAEDRIVERNR